ncbi:uncharacterized protein [Chlorocebus sabaeus]|uniref:uncharacterized protein n=1 Tax=Chlorocebus sabaeus TaxID=60711 RepID=UPI003BF97DCF
MILAAATASSSASNGSRSPGPASRRSHGRANARPSLGSLPPGCPAAAEAARIRRPRPEATRRRKLARLLLPAPPSPGSARDVVLRVRSGRAPAGQVSASRAPRRVCGKCEARGFGVGRRGLVPPPSLRELNSLDSETVS